MKVQSSRVLRLLLLCWLLAACSASQERPTGERVDEYRALSPEIYRLTPGDAVRVSVYQEADLSGKFQIEPDGTINYPLLGRIPAGGETTDKLQRRIIKGLSEGFLVDPDVRVAIERYKPIYIIGAINRPGEYAYNPGLTAQQAITLAGGPTKFAAEKIYVQRNEDAPSRSYRISPDTVLYPGDIVSVEERLF